MSAYKKFDMEALLLLGLSLFLQILFAFLSKTLLSFLSNESIAAIEFMINMLTSVIVGLAVFAVICKTLLTTFDKDASCSDYLLSIVIIAIFICCLESNLLRPTCTAIGYAIASIFN